MPWKNVLDDLDENGAPAMGGGGSGAWVSSNSMTGAKSLGDLLKEKMAKDEEGNKKLLKGMFDNGMLIQASPSKSEHPYDLFASEQKVAGLEAKVNKLHQCLSEVEKHLAGMREERDMARDAVSELMDQLSNISAGKREYTALAFALKKVEAKKWLKT